jgi:hypothetical protein
VAANVYEPGDFILTHRGRFAGPLIRLGQRIRYRGDRRKYAFWNHAALITSVEGDLVEALIRSGATRSHISKYKDVEFTLVRVHASAADQAQIIEYADRIVGMDYGFMQDLSGLLGLLSFGFLCVGFNRAINCSGLVASALTRMGAYFNRLPETMLPADLAFYYGAETPAPYQHPRIILMHKGVVEEAHV